MKKYDHETMLQTIARDIDWLKVPAFVNPDYMNLNRMQQIYNKGCEGAEYMPAVTYWVALNTMNDRQSADQVWDWLEQVGESDQAPPSEILKQGWERIAVFYLSRAVELWCHSVMDRLELEGRLTFRLTTMVCGRDA